jgi:O-antigen ligase
MATTPRARLVLLLGLFVLTAMISAAVHPGPAVPLFLLSLAGGSLLALLLSCLPLRVTVPVLLIAGTIAAVATLAWVIVVNPNELAQKSAMLAALHWSPVTTTVSLAPSLSPNLPGMLAAITGAGWTAFALLARRRWLLVAGVALAVASLAVVLASGSRSGMLAFAAGVAAVLLMRRPTRVALTAELLLAAMAAAGVIATWDRFERARIWSGTVRALIESPLVGRGIGSFPVAYVPGYGPPDPVGAHNTLLQIAIDLGLLGVIAFVALVVYAGVEVVKRARVEPHALILVGAGVAWLCLSLVESTLIATSRQQEPWFGWQELVTPLPFVFFAAAVAPLDGLVMPSREAVAAVLAGTIAAAGLSLTLTDAGWSRPLGVSDIQVLAATRSWVKACAMIRQAAPPDCPQAAGPGDPSGPFRWSRGKPLMENTRVTWSSAMGMFIVTGNFNLRYGAGCAAVWEGRRAGTGALHGYFVVGLRPVDDHRNFGALTLTSETPRIGGFQVVNRYRWQLACG